MKQGRMGMQKEQESNENLTPFETPFPINKKIKNLTSIIVLW